jgi:lipid A 3-O-deacylase
MKFETPIKKIVVTLLAIGFQISAAASDSASLEFGVGNRTQVIRAGAQWKWENHWWQSNGTHIGGYWDATAMVWRAKQFESIPDNNKTIWGIGITPVFRFQRDTLKGPYAEAAIGAHFLSDLYDNNGRKFSTRFQFGDHLSAGYVFQNGFDLSLKLQHFSNGSIKRPNHGVNFLFIRTSYPF